MLSHSQNNYAERLAEKLQRQAEKRGADSPAAEELAHVQPAAEAVTPQKRTSGTEGTKKAAQE